jgi:outer membrane lipoprotein carrier protein
MKNFIFLIFTLVVVRVASAQYDPQALTTLDAMSKKYKAYTSFEANVTTTMTNQLEGVKEEFKGKITVKGDKYRLAMSEQEIINNGTTQWTYIPAAKEVTIDNFDPNTSEINPSKIYELYKKGFKYLHNGERTEGGVVVEEIDLVPEKKDAQFFKIKMIISKKDHTIQSWTMMEKGGTHYKYTISKFTPNVTVSDTFFAFDSAKYPGVEIIDLR